MWPGTSVPTRWSNAAELKELNELDELMLMSCASSAGGVTSDTCEYCRLRVGDFVATHTRIAWQRGACFEKNMGLARSGVATCENACRQTWPALRHGARNVVRDSGAQGRNRHVAKQCQITADWIAKLGGIIPADHGGVRSKIWSEPRWRTSELCQRVAEMCQRTAELCQRIAELCQRLSKCVRAWRKGVRSWRNRVRERRNCVRKWRNGVREQANVSEYI